MSFCACIDFYRRRTSKNNMAAFREAVMLKIALARRRRRNLYQIYQDRCFWAPRSGCSCINSCTRKTVPNSLPRLPSLRVFIQFSHRTFQTNTYRSVTWNTTVFRFSLAWPTSLTQRFSEKDSSSRHVFYFRGNSSPLTHAMQVETVSVGSKLTGGIIYVVEK